MTPEKWSNHQEFSKPGRFAPPPSTARETGLTDLIFQLRRRKWTIIGVALSLSLLAAAVILQIEPRYVATSQVLIGGNDTNALGIDGVVSDKPRDTETVEGEVQVVRSRELAAKVTEQLNLYRSPEFNEALRPTSRIKQAASETFDWLRSVLPESMFSLVSESTARELPFRSQIDEERAKIVNKFLDRLRVGVVGQSRVISIAFESETPEIASQVVNKLADLYLVAQLEFKLETTRKVNAWLSDRLAVLKKAVLNSESAVERFKKDSSLIKGKSVNLIEEEISEVNRHYILAQSERAATEARLGGLQGESDSGIETVSEVLNSPLIQRLREQEAEVYRRVADASEEFGNLHPKMINLRSELSNLRERILLETKKIIQSLRNEINIARARENALRGNFVALKTQVADQKQLEVELRAIEREANADRALYEAFLTRSKETGTDENFQVPDARIISLADVPIERFYPPVATMLAVSVTMAVLIGLLIGLILEALGTGILSAKEVQAQFGLPVLAMVPEIGWFAKLKCNVEAYSVSTPRSTFTEAIRHVYTSLLLMEPGRASKAIAVTSSLPREGKTVLAGSLSRTIANAGQTVVLVDCDIHRPSAQQYFHAPRQPGLTEYLSGQAELTDVLRRDFLSDATIITAGGYSKEARDLFNSNAFKFLLHDLAGTFDVVLLDTAPVMAIAETKLLSKLVDKVIFVVRWDSTPRQTIAASLEEISKAECDIAGVVISMVNEKKHAKYGFGDSVTYYKEMRTYYGN